MVYVRIPPWAAYLHFQDGVKELHYSLPNTAAKDLVTLFDVMFDCDFHGSRMLFP